MCIIFLTLFSLQTCKIFFVPSTFVFIKSGQEEKITQLIESAVSQYVILESPLLLETKQHKLVNRILVVDVSPEIQLERAISRDGGSEATIKAIMNSQISRNDRISLADDIINNEQNFQSVQSRLIKFHQNYLNLANKNE